MFSIAELIGCGRSNDEITKAAEEAEEDVNRELAEKGTNFENKLKLLKVKHTVIKKERDQLLQEKRELTPIKDELSGYIRQIKELEAALLSQDEKAKVENSTIFNENRQLQLHLVTTKELADARQLRIDELETRARADKIQFDSMKMRLETLSSQNENSQELQTAIDETNAYKVALQIAKGEIVTMKNQLKVFEKRTEAELDRANSLQLQLDAAQQRIAELEKSSTIAMRSRSVDDEQQVIELKHTITMLTTQVKELEGSAHREKSLQRERDELTMAKTKLEVQVVELERQLKRDRDHLALVQQESDELIGSALAAAKGEVVAYRERINELESQSRKDRERSAQIQREFDELIAGRIVTHGESPTRLADRCKAVKDKYVWCRMSSPRILRSSLNQLSFSLYPFQFNHRLAAASLRSKQLINGIDEYSGNEYVEGLNEARQTMAGARLDSENEAASGEVKK